MVDTLLDEPGADNGAAGVTDAQHALADAEKAVNEARRVRSLLEQEIQHSEAETKLALHELDKAVAAVVSTDPARASVLSEFNRSARRALRCAQILRTAGLTVQGAQAHGLRFVISAAAAPMGVQAFAKDPAWLAARAALREDADAQLPGLPSAEDDPAENDDAAGAGAGGSSNRRI